MKDFVSIGQVSSILGISLSTIYRRLKTGLLQEDFRTLGGHRRFDVEKVKELVKLIINRGFTHLIINYKDRLLRFGSELIFRLCKYYDVEVII